MIRYEIRGKQILPTIPKTIGRVGDDHVEIVEFKMPTVYNETDLSVGFPFVHSVGLTTGARHTDALTMAVNGDEMVLTWSIGKDFTKEAENLKLQISIQGRSSVLWASDTVVAIIEESLFDTPATIEQIEEAAPVALFSARAMALSVDEEAIAENAAAETNEKEPVTLTGRTMSIPEESAKIGVRGDRNAETVTFLADQYYDGQDFSQKTWFVEVLNAAEEYDICAANAVLDTTTAKLSLEWLVGPRHAIADGKVSVRLRATENDSFIWQSYTGTFTIEKTFNDGALLPEPGLSVADQVLIELRRANDNLESAQGMIDQSVAAAETSASAAGVSAEEAASSVQKAEELRDEVAGLVNDLYFYQTAPPLALLETAVVLTTPTLAIIANQTN